jgi:hypothetical protein
MNKHTGIVLLMRIENIDQMMRNPVPELGGRFCGTDIHMAVNLHTVGIDNFDAFGIELFQ